MKIKKCYAPEKILKDVPENQGILKNALLKDERLIATDGTILASFPVERDINDTNGLIPLQSFTDAKEETKKSEREYKIAATNKTIETKKGDGTKNSIDRPTGHYPNCDAIMDDNLDHYIHAKINVLLLKKALAAIGENPECYILLGIRKDDPKKGLRIQAMNGAHIYMMPGIPDVTLQ